MVWSTMLFGAIGFLTGCFGRLSGLVAASCGALAWGVICGWIADQPLVPLTLQVLGLLFVVQATFLAGLAFRTLRAGEVTSIRRHFMRRR